jgi:hypothetical protein
MKSNGEQRAGVIHIVFKLVGTASAINIVFEYPPSNETRNQTAETIIKKCKQIRHQIGIPASDIRAPDE